MPETAKFSADGAENGLPFCFDDAVDDSYDISALATGSNWTTFSGLTDANYSSKTPEEIQEHIKQDKLKYIPFFWNFRGIGALDGNNVAYTNYVEDADDNVAEPKDRVCFTRAYTDSVNSSAISTYCGAFYWGDTTDESNLIGYGGIDIGSFFSNPNAEVFDGSTSAFICGINELLPPSQADSEVQYHTILGASFLFCAEAAPDQLTFSISENSISAANNTDGTEAEITSISTYTYPA